MFFDQIDVGGLMYTNEWPVFTGERRSDQGLAYKKIMCQQSLYV